VVRIFTTSRTLRENFIFTSIVICHAIGYAAPPSGTTIASSIVSSALSVSAAHAANNRITHQTTAASASPLWTELSLAQQHALAPLVGEWDKIDNIRKNKWLQMSTKFSKLSPGEQQRVHNRMREWAKLTPEQRRLVRENYTRAKKMAPSQKTEKWEQYQQLPAEQKSKLAADAPLKKRVTNLPPPSQGKTKAIPPAKLVAKRAEAEKMAKPTLTVAPAVVAPAAQPITAPDGAISAPQPTTQPAVPLSSPQSSTQPTAQPTTK
jgi:hypothetical protein